MTQVLLAVLSLTLLTADDRTRTIRFGTADAGKLPSGWKEEKTNKGDGSVWRVTTDRTAPSKSGAVLTQTAKGPKALFNLCIAPDVAGKDVEISVAFKAVAGDVDQGGGVVWRYQDANNYYVARMNPLEGNFRVYKVIAGKRVELDSKEDLPVKKGTWHTLKVRHAGEQIECFLDGKKELEAKDGDIAKTGGVGLWTKADAVTSFDELQISELRKK
jgi:hypothetical protein